MFTHSFKKGVVRSNPFTQLFLFYSPIPANMSVAALHYSGGAIYLPFYAPNKKLKLDDQGNYHYDL
jgi:hypothetical protein